MKINARIASSVLAAACLVSSGAGAAEHSDTWLTTKVKAELATHNGVSATHTSVFTKNGVVTLNGTARSDAERQMAEDYARKIDGVRGVRNEIVVRGGSNQAPMTT